MAALVAAALLALPAPARADGTVEVTISGIRNSQGLVRVGLCTRADFLSAHCARNAEAPARQGTVTVPLAGVPPGLYAVQAWHDANVNGQLDRNALGIPREGVGFSNDPILLLGPPSFAAAAFAVGAEGGSAALRLRYFRN